MQEQTLEQQATELENKENEGKLLTEVTSIAKENEKGANIKVPNSEEIARRASMTFIEGLRTFGSLFQKLSARGKNRVMNSILDLPQAKIPVMLKDDLEKQAFLIGQKTINARFLLTQYHISQEVQKRALEQKQKGETTNE